MSRYSFRISTFTKEQGGNITLGMLNRLAEVNDPLIGLRVKIIFDDDSDERSGPLNLPAGTIVRRFVGTDREVYHQVRLDSSVITEKYSGGKWVLSDLLISPVFKGTKLLSLLSEKVAIPVAIANLLKPIPPDEVILDFSKVDYFTRGTVFASIGLLMK